MQIYTSYFYQIRFFPKNYIPISTAKWDPKWFHNGQGDDYIFKDKRGVYNGLRCNIFPLTPEEEAEITICNPECMQDYHNCKFLKTYRQHLENIDFQKFINELQLLINKINEIEKFQEEPIIVFIVYETPNNICSERGPLLEWLNSHGVAAKELDYPIEIK